MQNLICAQLGRAPASDPCAVKSANLRSVAGSKVAAEQRLGPAGEQKFVYLLCSHCMAARLRSCELVSFRHEIGKLTQSLLNTEPSEHAAIVGSELRDHEGTVLPAALAWAPSPGQRLASNLAVSFIQLLSVQLWGHYWYYWKHRRWRNFLLFYIILSHLSARFSNMKLTFLLLYVTSLYFANSEISSKICKLYNAQYASVATSPSGNFAIWYFPKYNDACEVKSSDMKISYSRNDIIITLRPRLAWRGCITPSVLVIHDCGCCVLFWPSWSQDSQTEMWLPAAAQHRASIITPHHPAATRADNELCEVSPCPEKDPTLQATRHNVSVVPTNCQFFQEASWKYILSKNNQT